MMMISRIFPSLIFIQCNSQIKSFIVIFLDCLLISFTHNKNIFSLAIFSSFSIVRTVTAQFVPFLSLSLIISKISICFYFYIEEGKNVKMNDGRVVKTMRTIPELLLAGWWIFIQIEISLSFGLLKCIYAKWMI